MFHALPVQGWGSPTRPSQGSKVAHVRVIWVLGSQPVAHRGGVTQGWLFNKSLTRSTISTFPAQLHAPNCPLVLDSFGRGALGARARVGGKVVPKSDPLPSQPAVKTLAREAEPLTGMFFTSSGGCAKRASGQHEELGPRRVRVTDNGGSDRAGQTSGPQTTKLFGNVADNRHKPRMYLLKARQWLRGSRDILSLLCSLRELSPYGRGGIEGLRSLSARRACVTVSATDKSMAERAMLQVVRRQVTRRHSSEPDLLEAMLIEVGPHGTVTSISSS